MTEQHSRRDFLWRLGGGLGGIALAQLAGAGGTAGGAGSPCVRALDPSSTAVCTIAPGSDG